MSGKQLFAKDLAVFLPHPRNVKEIEDVLKKDPALKGYNVKVYARIKDLLASSTSSKTALILPGVFEEKPPENYVSVASFLVGGKAEVDIKLVTLGKTDKSAKPVLGSIDLFGDRRQAKKLAKSLTDNKIKRVKLVQKAVDLYPMLNLNNVNQILLFDQDVNYIEKMSEVKLNVIGSKRIKTPHIFVKSEDKELHQSLLKIGSKTLRSFGYESVGSVK